MKWWYRRIWYLEWGTARAPEKFSRPTFPQLHQAAEKLIAVRTPGAVPKGIYDNAGLHFDASSVGFVPWYHLRGVRNKSIKKTAKYEDELKHDEARPLVFREELEELSRRFNAKYLLALMNSTFAKDWLATKRRSKIHVYPDDWKSLPILPISLERQQEFGRVDRVLSGCG